MQQLNFIKVGGGIGKMQEHYGHTAAVQIDNIIKISGQGGWDKDFNFPHKELKNEIKQALDNVAFVLETAGSSWAKVYSVTSYFTDKITDEMHEVMVDYFRKNCDNLPIWTTVQVAGLGNPNMHVEIVVEAIKNRLNK